MEPPRALTIADQEAVVVQVGLRNRKPQILPHRAFRQLMKPRPDHGILTHGVGIPLSVVFMDRILLMLLHHPDQLEGPESRLLMIRLPHDRLQGFAEPLRSRARSHGDLETLFENGIHVSGLYPLRTTGGVHLGSIFPSPGHFLSIPCVRYSLWNRRSERPADRAQARYGGNGSPPGSPTLPSVDGHRRPRMRRRAGC